MGGYSEEFATKGDRNGQREGEVRVAICFYCCFEDKKHFSTFTHWPRRRKTPDASKIRQLQRQCSWEGGRREIDPDPRTNASRLWSPHASGHIFIPMLTCFQTLLLSHLLPILSLIHSLNKNPRAMESLLGFLSWPCHFASYMIWRHVTKL